MIPEKFKDLHFDAVIPSHLLINPDIEPAAKVFYGIVRNLTKVEGYCYAKNKYLAELMDVDVRTIQRWLKSLQDNGYIESEFESNDFNAIRKIFIVDNFKKSLRCDKNGTPPRQKRRTPTTKTSHIDKEDIPKEDIPKKTVCPAPPVGASVSKITKITSDGKEIIICQDDIFKKSIALRKDWRAVEIMEAWDILVACPGVVNEGFGFIEGTIENLRVKRKFNKMNEKVTRSEERSWNTGIIQPTDCEIPSEIDITRLL